MIVSGAFNIYPSELETVIASHPAIREVAVFGVPDPRWGETPTAVCVVDSSAAVTAEEVMALVTAEMGAYLKPTRVEFTHEPLPRSVVGKVLRRALREPYWKDQDSRVGGA